MNVRLMSWGAACLIALHAVPARALDIPPELKKRFLSETEGKPKEPILESDAPDNSIDPDAYQVGGGDGFRISIVGMPSDEYFPVIDPNGNLYDGELGLIPLGRVSLSQALKTIQDRVHKSLKKNYEVYVSLKKVKRVSVTVSGAVNVSGTYQLPGTYRLLDAIRSANGGVLPSVSKCDYRKVLVRNRDSVKTYDLLRFFSKQDLSQNPYIYPGDNLNLNPIDAKVYVSGDVLDPVIGWVPLVPGESLADLLAVLNLSRSADSSSILVQKADTVSRGSLQRLSVRDAAGFALHANDLITVGSREAFQRPDTIMVKGEVRQPGTYPMLSAQATLRELIGLAGGVTERAEPGRTVIIRHRKTENVLPPAADGEKPMLPGVKNPLLGNVMAVRPEVSSSISDLQSLQDYAMMAGTDLDAKAMLQDGDEIYVPRHDPFVYVSGSVRRPGPYPYKKGNSVSDYVDAAGGTTNKADTKNLFVLASFDGVTQVRDAANLSQGDVIVVPAGVEYKRFTAIVLPILQILPGVLSLLVTFVILEKQKN